ncbi:AraC family transcriptional regulator [Solimonas sp. K1W22B-7]|nr:AraC family transcriptional regulator [Solimonas sp. K1W22B-7]
MVELMTQLAPGEGYTRCALEPVQLMRSDRPLARMPVMYEPCICVIVQGRKRGFLGDDRFTYDARSYLVSTVPMLFLTETEASARQPLLGITLRINPAEVAELALALDESQRREALPRSMMCTPLDEAMSGALLRLLEMLRSPAEARLLGPGILREIYYRVLSGEQGPALRAALVQGGAFGKIAKALRRIHAEYPGNLDVGLLARDAGMSVPAFHVHFRNVTSTSPIQYLKSTRLHQARLLMVRGGITAAAAANQVGYESPSQFSREFKRLFGRTPTEEALEMKQTLALWTAP